MLEAGNNQIGELLFLIDRYKQLVIGIDTTKNAIARSMKV